MTPNLDGIETDYFEWISAGFAVPGGGESMHRTDRLLEKIFFGFDRHSFYLRLDLVPEKMATFPPGGAIHIQFAAPEECSLVIEHSEEHQWRCKTIAWPAAVQAPELGANRILELGLPLEALGVRQAAGVKFCVLILERDRELERFPSAGLISVPTDPWGLDQQEWMV